MTMMQFLLLAITAYFAYEVYKHINTLESKGSAEPAPEPVNAPVAPTLTPTSADALIAQADDAFGSQNFRDARTYLERAEKLDPDSPQIANKLGVVLDKLDESEEAMKQFQKALRLEPQNDLAHLYLAGIYEQKQRHDEARIHYEEAIAIDETFDEAHLRYAKMLERLGDKSLACDHYRKAEKLGADDPDLAPALQRCE